MSLERKIIKVEFKDVQKYEPPKHFNCISYRLQHKDTTGVQNFWVGLSHFLPEGGAEMDASDFEKVYVMISGSMTIVTEDGKELTLNPLDSVYIPPGVKRYLINKTKQPATMLVIASYPPSK